MPHILVVDDDPAICMVVRLWLEKEGFVVTTADGTVAGLQALEQSHFDLMIVDIFMPGMHGFESVRTFHERAMTVPLIAISGYAFAATREPVPDFLSMTLELGATSCLRKPFKPATLLSVVHDCLKIGGAREAAAASVG